MVGFVGQDVLVDLPEAGARVDAVGFGEGGSRAQVGFQCVGPATGPVECDHQHAPGPFICLLADQVGPQVGYNLVVPSQCKVCVGQIMERPVPLLEDRGPEALPGGTPGQVG